jgi:hypothetical protein
MPCLLFSRIVPAFNSQNVSAIGAHSWRTRLPMLTLSEGPLLLLGLLYGTIGATMAWGIRKVFWIPHRFRHGIMVAGCWGNYGDIRACRRPGRSSLCSDLLSATAIALGITAHTPFSGTNDENLAVAYISVFILLFFVSDP